MTILGFLVLLLIAAICGAIAQIIVGYSTGGCLVSSAVGLVGALLGFWLSNQLGLPIIFSVNIQGQSFPIVWTIIGSVIFVAVVSLIHRGRR